MLRRTPLRRHSKRIRKVSQKRADQLKEYYAARSRFLSDHPICMVWLVEHGFTNVHTILDSSSVVMFHKMGAPNATEIHHANKRHGARLLDETHWWSVCRAAHERIENNKAWARAKGFLLNF